MSRVTDPNEELLHWMHVMELARDVYSADASSSVAVNDASSIAPTASSSQQWNQIAAHAFFELAMVDEQTKAQFVARSGTDSLLLETLETLVVAQSQQTSQQEPQEQLSRRGGPSEGDADASSNGSDSRNPEALDPLAVRVTFLATLERLSLETARPPSQPQPELVRGLRKAFATLRSSGLLFLEDMDADRHELLSFEFALKPALLRRLQGACESACVRVSTHAVVEGHYGLTD